jgi:hypothetical protein
MAFEWVMFPAHLSQAKNPEEAFDVKTLRMHLLDRGRRHESVGYVEQRLTRYGDHRTFFLTVLRGDRIHEQQVIDLQAGMDILDLVSRERKADDDDDY